MAATPTPEQLQSVRGALRSPRRLKTEVLGGLVVALALIPEAIAFSIITALHIVLGEQAPKLVGLASAERVALAVALPLQVFYKVFSLPIRALDWASVRAVQLIGVKATAEHASTYTEDELRRLIDISRESGHLRAEERRLIHRVFEFSDTLVREAMVPRTEMAAIPYTNDLEQITRAFEQHRYSRLPVYRETFDDVCGFIHSKDVMPCQLHPEKFNIEDVLQPPLYVVDTARLEHVLRQMQKAKMQFGFVVDEHGGLEGIITLEDLLEEIVGEISDEHDEEVNEQITQMDEHTYVLDGGLAVRDLNRRLKLTVPESEAYTTVGGFLMTEAGHVLKPGEVVQHEDGPWRPAVRAAPERRVLLRRFTRCRRTSCAGRRAPRPRGPGRTDRRGSPGAPRRGPCDRRSSWRPA